MISSQYLYEWKNFILIKKMRKSCLLHRNGILITNGIQIKKEVEKEDVKISDNREMKCFFN